MGCCCTIPVSPHLLSELTRIISNMGYKYVNSLFGWLYECCPQNSHIQYIYIQNCDPADPWCRTLVQQKRALFLHASAYIFFINQGGKKTMLPVCCDIKKVRSFWWHEKGPVSFHKTLPCNYKMPLFILLRNLGAETRIGNWKQISHEKKPSTLSVQRKPTSVWPKKWRKKAINPMCA